MSPQEAFQRLGLGGGGTPEQIEAAFAARSARLKQRMVGASSASVREAIEADMWELDAARTIALQAAGSAAPESHRQKPKRVAPLDPEPLIRTTISVVAGTMVGGKAEVKHPIAYVGGAQAFAASIPGPEMKQASLFVVDDRLVPDAAARADLAAHVQSLAAEGQAYVALLEVLQHDGHAVVLAEHLPGRTLASEMHTRKTAGRPVPTERALAIGLGICEGLEAIHRKKAHGDLRPDNVWLLGSDAVKVLDLGLSKALKDRPFPEVDAAARAYRAPEQGGPSRDARSDLYAAGAMLYELLTGAPPREPGVSIRDVRKDLPDHVAAAIDRALAPKPEDRHANAGAMAAALRSRASGARRVPVVGLAGSVLLAAALAWGATAIAWVPSGQVGVVGAARLGAGVHLRRPWPLDRMTLERSRETTVIPRPDERPSAPPPSPEGTKAAPKAPDPTPSKPDPKPETPPAAPAPEAPRPEPPRAETPNPDVPKPQTPRPDPSAAQNEARATYETARASADAARSEWRGMPEAQGAPEPADAELAAARKALDDGNYAEAARLMRAAEEKYRKAARLIEARREADRARREAEQREQQQRAAARATLVNSLDQPIEWLSQKRTVLVAQAEAAAKEEADLEAQLAQAQGAAKNEIAVRLARARLDRAKHDQAVETFDAFQTGRQRALEAERDAAIAALDAGGSIDAATTKAADLAGRGPGLDKALDRLEAVAQMRALLLPRWGTWLARPAEVRTPLAPKEAEAKRLIEQADAAIAGGNLDASLQHLSGAGAAMDALESAATKSASVDGARQGARTALSMWETTYAPWKGKNLAEPPAVVAAKQALAQADAAAPRDPTTASTLYAKAEADLKQETSRLMQDAEGVKGQIGDDGLGEVHRVVDAGDVPRLARLLQMGANPSLRDRGGETPAARATRLGNAPALGLLLDAGAAASEMGHRAGAAGNAENVPLAFLAVDAPACFDVLVAHRRPDGTPTLGPTLAKQVYGGEMLSHYIASRPIPCAAKERLFRAMLQSGTLDPATQKQLLTLSSAKSGNTKTAEQLLEGAGCAALAQYLRETLARLP
ncbi:MAG: protein kinase [Phycisphaerae bacterium]|nr:protein kinase [Phycisphaerae bacterium]